MGITRIDRLNSCKIFRNFIWSTGLNEFARFNLIYGWNGSGKTTISRILRDLELHRVPATGKVRLLIDGKIISETDFPNASIPVRVFNKEFVAENVFPPNGADISPIFVLGEENIKKQKELEKYKLSLAEAEKLHQELKKKKKTNSGLLDKHCIDHAKDIKDLLRGSGNNSFNNYDKKDYRHRIEKMLVDGDVANYHLKDTERERLNVKMRASQKDIIHELTYTEPDFTSLKNKVVDLLSVTVISKTIDSLKDNPAISEWVCHGLPLHKKQDVTECLFCGQSLPEQRLSELEQHFNTAHSDLINSLDKLTKNIDRALKSVSVLETLNRTMFYEHLIEEYDVIHNKLEHYRDQSCVYLKYLVDDLSNKRKHPFERVLINSDRLHLPDNNVLDRFRDIIQKHNQECANHTDSVANARERIANEHIAKKLNEYKTLHTSVEECNVELKPIEEQISDLCDKISNLEAEVTLHGKPAENLNNDLHQYLGHKELYLKVQDHGYAIIRDGIPALQLSEGETTAIALLYFLKSLSDHRFDLQNGVVVLDDPVSSLDANALFLAHGFIKNHTKDAGQLFILTHNFTLFRQVRNWFHSIKGKNKKDVKLRPAQFYMLNCLSDDEGRYSVIQPLDPLLKNYESDYQYLFAHIQRSASSPTSTLESNYMLPNMARRLLEAFLAFRQPDMSGQLQKKLDNVKFDSAKKYRYCVFFTRTLTMT